MRRRVVSSAKGQGKTSDLIIELFLLATNLFMNGKQRINNGSQRVILEQQFEHVLAEARTDRPTEKQAVFLEHAPYLVLEISADADEPGTRNQDRADGLALLAFDTDFAVPADPDEFGEAARIILVALFDPDRQSGVGMARVVAKYMLAISHVLFP
jgi:hypothetical protein